MAGLSKRFDLISMQLKGKLCGLRAVSIERNEGVRLVGELSPLPQASLSCSYTDFRHRLSLRALQQSFLGLRVHKDNGGRWTMQPDTPRDGLTKHRHIKQQPGSNSYRLPLNEGYFELTCMRLAVSGRTKSPGKRFWNCVKISESGRSFANN